MLFASAGEVTAFKQMEGTERRLVGKFEEKDTEAKSVRVYIHNRVHFVYLVGRITEAHDPGLCIGHT